MGWDTKFATSVCVCVCTVTDFSAGTLPIGVKFCKSTPRTGLLLFWGNSPRDGPVLGINRGHMAGYMLLVEALVNF